MYGIYCRYYDRYILVLPLDIIVYSKMYRNIILNFLYKKIYTFIVLEISFIYSLVKLLGLHEVIFIKTLASTVLLISTTGRIVMNVS